MNEWMNDQEVNKPTSKTRKNELRVRDMIKTTTPMKRVCVVYSLSLSATGLVFAFCTNVGEHRLIFLFMLVCLLRSFSLLPWSSCTHRQTIHRKLFASQLPVHCTRTHKPKHTHMQTRRMEQKPAPKFQMDLTNLAESVGFAIFLIAIAQQKWFKWIHQSITQWPAFGLLFLFLFLWSAHVHSHSRTRDHWSFHYMLLHTSKIFA